MSAELQFGYFNFKGRGQISRLLLSYTKTVYKDVKYSFSEIAEWIQKDKKSLDLDFPSLPYLIDGKLKLTESKAIQRYIIHRAKRTDLVGRSNKQAAYINNIEGVLRDVFSQLIKLYLSSRFLQQRKQTIEAISQKLDYLNGNVGTKQHFLSRLTYVDFVATVIFEYIRVFFPHQYKAWPNIDRLTTYVNSLPQIISYYSSSQAVSDIIAAESARDPKFFGLKALYSKQQTPSSVQKQADSPQIQIIQKKNENYSKLSSQLEIQQLKMTVQSGTMPSTFKRQSVQNVQRYDNNLSEVLQKSSPNHNGQLQPQDKLEPGQEQRQIGRQQLQLHQQQVNESITQKKPFKSRVQLYMKAAQAANKKGVPGLKNQSQKKQNLTFSNINVQSRINSKTEASWQINDVQQNETSISSSQISICLGYWGIRGLAQIQRHLLSYCELKFSQKIYQGRQEWIHGDKLALNIPLPNLPYLIQGDFKITQSLAIDRYIIRCSQKKELLGQNLKDETQIQNFVKILSDLFRQLRVLCFTEDLENTKAQQLLQKYMPVFERMSQFVKNQQHAFGYLTWTDFYIAQVSYYIEKIFPETYRKHEFFRNIRNSVLSDSKIQRYYERSGAIKGPFMPPSAKIIF